MINIVIIDDHNFFIKNLESFIKTKFIIKKLKCKIHCFNSFDKNFWNLVNSKLENSIYILDIEVPPYNGIDIARKIRSIDENTEILFVTINDNNNYRYIVSSSSIKSFGFINKKNILEDLDYKLDEFIKILDKRNLIKIKENNSLVSINLEDIIYLKYQSNIRKTIIYTTNDEVESYKSSKYFEKMLNEISNKFARTHKSCIVNVKKVKKFDFKNEEIIFKNSTKIKLLSNKYKKEIEYKFNLD